MPMMVTQSSAPKKNQKIHAKIPPPNMNHNKLNANIMDTSVSLILYKKTIFFTVLIKPPALFRGLTISISYIIG
jgi:hypothetical protein